MRPCAGSVRKTNRITRSYGCPKPQNLVAQKNPYKPYALNLEIAAVAPYKSGLAPTPYQSIMGGHIKAVNEWGQYPTEMILENIHTHSPVFTLFFRLC